MIMIDYHIHTSLCNHAQHGMDGYVRSAISRGLTEICFLDHLTLLETDRKTSMSLEELPHYLTAVGRLKSAYKDRIHIRAGLEIDYLPEEMHRVEELAEKYGIDAIGGSIHFLNGLNIASRRSAELLKGADFSSLCHKYMDAMDRMLDHSVFNFICHVDLPKKFGTELPRSFRGDLEAILIKAAQKGTALEINTSGLTHPAEETYPSLEMLSFCKDCGVLVTTGSDAHKHNQVARKFHHVYDHLKKAGYTSVTGFHRRKPTPIPIGETT